MPRRPGLALERIKGRGYRLLEAPDFLDAEGRQGAPRRRSTRSAAIAAADHGRGRRPDRLDVLRAHAPGAAARRPRRRARRRMADRRTRPARARVDRRSPAAASRFRWAGGSSRARVPRRPVARRRRRRRARARGRRLRGRRAQVAERPHPPPPQVRRHPDRVERRRARPVDDGHRRRASTSACRRRRARTSRSPGHRPRDHRRPQGAADRPQPAARARCSPSSPTSSHLYAKRRLRAVRRRVAASPRVPGQAGEAAAARRRDASPARSPASTRAARWCSPTARAARASSPARSRCAAPERCPQVARRSA